MKAFKKIMVSLLSLLIGFLASVQVTHAEDSIHYSKVKVETKTNPNPNPTTPAGDLKMFYNAYGIQVGLKNEIQPSVYSGFEIKLDYKDTQTAYNPNRVDLQLKYWITEVNGKIPTDNSPYFAPYGTHNGDAIKDGGIVISPYLNSSVSMSQGVQLKRQIPDQQINSITVKILLQTYPKRTGTFTVLNEPRTIYLEQTYKINLKSPLKIENLTPPVSTPTPTPRPTPPIQEVTEAVASLTTKVKATAVYNSAKGADIRWKPANGVNYYAIWRKRTDPVSKVLEEKVIAIVDANKLEKVGSDFRYIDFTIKDKYTDTGKHNEGGWVYYITARSSNSSSNYKEGPISNKLNLYRLRNPNITKIESQSGGKVRLTWNRVVNAHAYEVQYTKDNGRTWTKCAQVTGDSITVTSLSKGARYNFRVRAQKTNKDLGLTWSEYSLWRSAVIK